MDESAVAAGAPQALVPEGYLELIKEDEDSGYGGRAADEDEEESEPDTPR